MGRALSSSQTIDIASLATTAEPVPPLLQVDLRAMYLHRSERLRTLAKDHHTMADYLSFAADIVDTQYRIFQEKPLPAAQEQSSLVVDWHTAPLSKQTVKRDGYWLEVFDQLLIQLSEKHPNGAIAETLARLRNTSVDAKEKIADQLLTGDVSGAGSDGAPFVWAALSLYWSQLVRQKPLIPHETVGVARDLCPICGNAPVASVVTIGPPEGVRYLHCALCESEWRYVRAQCTNCEKSGKLHYWSLDDKDAAVKTESCGDCHSHLKILFQNKDGHIDPVADDLASLALDARMEEEGFARSAVNPFLFPAPEHD